MIPLLKKLFNNGAHDQNGSGLRAPSKVACAYMNALKERRGAEAAMVVVRNTPQGRVSYLAWLDGSFEWFLNDKLHCDNGPAISRADGTKMWFRHGVLHNDDGPAIERPDGSAECWKNGEPVKMIPPPAQPAGPTPAEKTLAAVLDNVQNGAAQPIAVSAPLRLKKSAS